MLKIIKVSLVIVICSITAFTTLKISKSIYSDTITKLQLENQELKQYKAKASLYLNCLKNVDRTIRTATKEVNKQVGKQAKYDKHLYDALIDCIMEIQGVKF